MRINCLSYAPESTYCLVIGKMKSGEVFCLYPTVFGNVGIGEINNGYYYENYNYCCQYLPPLFCAEKYTGELPENCAFMKKLSKQLLNHPELGCEIGERIHHFYPFNTDRANDIFGKFYRYERWRFNENDWQVPPEKIFEWLEE